MLYNNNNNNNIIWKYTARFYSKLKINIYYNETAALKINILLGHHWISWSHLDYWKMDVMMGCDLYVFKL